MAHRTDVATGCNPSKPTSGVRFYARILSYFRDDRLLIGILVGLIWLALLAGALEPLVMALLIDSVLSGKTVTTPYIGALVNMFPAGRTGQVLGLALAWFTCRLFLDV